MGRGRKGCIVQNYQKSDVGRKFCRSAEFFISAPGLIKRPRRKPDYYYSSDEFVLWMRGLNPKEVADTIAKGEVNHGFE